MGIYIVQAGQGRLGQGGGTRLVACQGGRQLQLASEVLPGHSKQPLVSSPVCWKWCRTASEHRHGALLVALHKLAPSFLNQSGRYTVCTSTFECSAEAPCTVSLQVVRRRAVPREVNGPPPGSDVWQWTPVVFFTTSGVPGEVTEGMDSAHGALAACMRALRLPGEASCLELCWCAGLHCVGCLRCTVEEVVPTDCPAQQKQTMWPLARLAGTLHSPSAGLHFTVHWAQVD